MYYTTLNIFDENYAIVYGFENENFYYESHISFISKKMIYNLKTKKHNRSFIIFSICNLVLANIFKTG